MTVAVSAAHALDFPFRAVYAGGKLRAGIEYGFTGFAAARSEDIPMRFSAWLPGDRPRERLAELAEWKRQGRHFRFFFPERYYAPAREARALFTGNHLGTPVGLLVKVQAHPERLVHPERRGERHAWLCEPILNRIPVAVWMLGPVADVRVLSGRVAEADVHVVMLRHTAPARQSILELSISPGLRLGAEPAVQDRFEATGSDGYLRVTGIWQEAVHAPRLEVHRGATDIVQRDLRRDFSQIYENAAAHWEKPDRYDSCRLAEAYLDACGKIAEIAPQEP